MLKPFEGLKVYYSGSINGATEPDPDFAQKLVEFITNEGANVLSEHVPIRDQSQKDEVFYRRTGIKIQDVAPEDKPAIIRCQDLAWVRESDRVVVLANAPSHGVGIEIHESIMRGKPVLCLVREDLLPRLSFMVRGITPQEAPEFHLRTYRNLEQAQQHIFDFLTIRK